MPYFPFLSQASAGTKTKGQGSGGNEKKKKVSPRKHLGLGSFSLACDRGGLPVRARRERHTRHQSNLKNSDSDSTISVSLTGVSSPLGNP